MNRRSPTLEGFAAMVRQPSFGAAEIAWRWSFGFAAAFLLTFSFVQYLDTLPVTARDIFFLRTGQSALVSQALARIFQGSTPRLILATLILVPALALAWAILGAIGRAATLRELVRYFRTGAEHETAGTPVRSIFGLNFLRLAATLAAAVGCFGAVLLAGMASSPKNPAPGSALLIFLMLFMLVSLAWATINWFLSLSAVFVVSGQQDTFGALSAAANLCRTRSGSVFAAGTWFGLAHLTAFVVATSIVAFPLAFLGFLPTGIVLGGVLVVTLIYFAVTDFLYVGRLAAYVAIVELPIPVDTPAPSIQHSALSMQPWTTIDKDELILCDALMSTQHSALSIPNSDSIDKDETILSDYSQPDSPDQAKS